MPGRIHFLLADGHEATGKQARENQVLACIKFVAAQHHSTLQAAAAKCCKSILHNLDILLYA